MARHTHPPVWWATTTEPDNPQTATDTDKRQPATDPMVNTHRSEATTTPATAGA